MVFTGGSTDHCCILPDWFFSSLAFLLVSLLWVPAAYSGCTGSPDPSGSHIHMFCFPAQCGEDARRWALTQGELHRAGERRKLYIMTSSRLLVHISEHTVTNTLRGPRIFYLDLSSKLSWHLLEDTRTGPIPFPEDSRFTLSTWNVSPHETLSRMSALGRRRRVTQTAVTVHRRWDDILRPSVRPSAGERDCPAHVARVYSIPGWCRHWSHWLTHVSQTWIQLRTSGMLWISDWRHQIELTGTLIQVWGGGSPGTPSAVSSESLLGLQCSHIHNWATV